MRVLPRSQGDSALPWFPRAFMGRGVRGAVGAVVAVTAIALVAPNAAVDATAGADAWTPSDWTGEVAGPPVPGIGLPPAPFPGTPVPLPEGYDVAPQYEGQAQCDPTAKPGTQKVADLIKGTYGANQVVWIPRACTVGGQSEHKEGRALDWMTDVRKPQERANAEAFLTWLMGPDQFGKPYGNAMRLGVMYIGWNDRIWRGYDIRRGWTELRGCFAKSNSSSDTVCHRDHIHISFTWDGASARTSFWDGTPMDAPYCPKDRSGATTTGMQRSADVVPVGPVQVLNTRTTLGVEKRCRLQQDRFRGDSHRIFAKVTGQGGVPETGVAAVRVRVTAQGSNAPSTVRTWSPGQSSSVPVVKVPMNADAFGEAIVPVASDGTIALAVTAGASDIVLDVLGFYPQGDQPNKSEVIGETTVLPMTESGGAPAPAPAPAPLAPPTEFSPATEEDEFFGIGAEIGYESTEQGALQPGEVRNVPLTGVPANATSALIAVTMREATKRGKLRIGQVTDKGVSASVRFPKTRSSTALIVVPVVNGRVDLAASKKPAVHVRVDVMGYSVGATPTRAVGLSAVRVHAKKIEAGETVSMKIRGLAGIPKKKKKATAVILKVTTRGKAGADGRVGFFPTGGADPGTRSAPIVNKKAFSSFVVSDISTTGEISFTPSVTSKVRVQVVGFVQP